MTEIKVYVTVVQYSGVCLFMGLQLFRSSGLDWAGGTCKKIFGQQLRKDDVDLESKKPLGKLVACKVCIMIS